MKQHLRYGISFAAGVLGCSTNLEVAERPMPRETDASSPSTVNSAHDAGADAATPREVDGSMGSTRPSPDLLDASAPLDAAAVTVETGAGSEHEAGATPSDGSGPEGGPPDAGRASEAGPPNLVDWTEPPTGIVCQQGQPCVDSRESVVMGTMPALLQADGSVWRWGYENYFAGDTHRSSAWQVEGLPDVVALQGKAGIYCALGAEGRVWCWGNSLYAGALGPLSPELVGSDFDAYYSVASPAPIPGIEDVRAIALGRYHACAVKDDGSVWCWGEGYSGQLGPGVPFSDEPVRVEGLAPVRSIVGASESTCALTIDDEVLCWGSSAMGQLGDGQPTDLSDVGWAEEPLGATPVKVEGLKDVASLSAGYETYCALSTDHQVACWGSGHVDLGFPSSIPIAMTDWDGATAVAAGENHICAIVADGRVSCLGSNDFGELGVDVFAGGPQAVFVQQIEDAVLLFAQSRNTCVVTRDGRVSCWGDDAYGQLGHGLHGETDVPQPITSDEEFIAVSAGSASCALTREGRVHCWGSNSSGQLGVDPAALKVTGSPKEIVGLEEVLAVSSGGSHVCALLADETVSCWGDNSLGRLGNPNVTDAWSWVPVKVDGLSNVVQVTATSGATCARLADGSVKCWGPNDYGLLGRDPLDLEFSAAPLSVPALANVIDLTMGNYHACAQRDDLSVICWGGGAHAGVGGLQDWPQVALPTEVPQLADALNVSVTPSLHTCRLDADRTVACADARGTQFATLSDVNDVDQLVAPCAIRADESLVCWEDTFMVSLLADPEGETLSDGGTAAAPQAPEVREFPELGPVAYVSPSGPCVIKAEDSSIACWGTNTNCELGTCPFSTTPLPIVLPSAD